MIEFAPQINADEFHRNGFVIIDLPPSLDIDALREKVLALKPGDDDFNRVGGFAHSASLDSNIAYKTEVDRIGREAFAPIIEKLVPSHKIFISNLYIKPALGEEQPVHADWTITNSPQDVGINMWCPLIDTTKENGTLELVPGSHKLTDQIFTYGNPTYYQNIQEELKRLYLQSIPLKKGQAVIFENSILHYSPPNRTNRMRPVLFNMSVPKHANINFYSYNANKPSAPLEVYEADFEFYFIKFHEYFFSQRLPKRLKRIGKVASPMQPYTSAQFKTRMMVQRNKLEELFGKSLQTK